MLQPDMWVHRTSSHADDNHLHAPRPWKPINIKVMQKTVQGRRTRRKASVWQTKDNVYRATHWSPDSWPTSEQHLAYHLCAVIHHRILRVCSYTLAHLNGVIHVQNIVIIHWYMPSCQSRWGENVVKFARNLFLSTASFVAVHTQLIWSTYLQLCMMLFHDVFWGHTDGQSAILE